MFYPIEGGSVYDVADNCFGYVYKCNLPPIGYGVNSVTGEVEKTDIICRSEIPEEQYWERYTLPVDWRVKRISEKERQRYDKYYIDPYLEAIRRKEWHRRLCGIWFWNYNPHKKESELKYITGTHYLYCTYWKFQGKFMDFRINDMEAWYIVKYCETDPDCLGVNELTKRKIGKTAKLGCWMYDRTSKPPTNQHCAFQSKADNDAAEVMKKAVVHPWQKLPDFFRPIYDTMKSDDPNELRFFHTARRGATTEIDREEEEALESWIEYGASGESVFDGPELDTYGCDEAGKTKKPVSIKERQNTVRYCSEIDGVFKGKHYYTTTVEPERGEEENYEFQELTANSNPLERDDNGRTGTGLYTFFLPAHKGMYFDQYGFPDEEKALRFLENTKKSYIEKGDTRGLSSFKRKNPISFKEAFSADGQFSLYNPELLNNRLDEISWTTKLTERGDLIWKDGFKVKRPKLETERNNPITGEKEYEYEPSEIEWVNNVNGKYERITGWEPKEPNNVYERNGMFYPNNINSYALGCDPFKYDKTKDKRRSNCVGFVYQIPDPLYPDDIYDNSFALKYAYREESTRLSNEDILKMAWWCGCEVLFERNVNHWKNDFIDWDCSPFLSWMPGELEPGIITATGSSGVQMICNYTEAYINQHISKVYFKSLLRKDTGWLGFKIEDTEKFDEPMSAGITLIKVKGVVRKSKIRVSDVSDFFPKRRAIA